VHGEFLANTGRGKGSVQNLHHKIFLSSLWTESELIVAEKPEWLRRTTVGFRWLANEKKKRRKKESGNRTG